jgi:hypothetical protein
MHHGSPTTTSGMTKKKAAGILVTPLCGATQRSPLVIPINYRADRKPWFISDSCYSFVDSTIFSVS